MVRLYDDHAGDHCTTLMDLCKNVVADEWLDLFKTRYLYVLHEAKPGDSIGVFCVCDDGIGLSVAYATAMEFVLRGVVKGPPTHLEFQYSRQNICHGGTCSNCNTANSGKKHALDAFARKWTSLFDEVHRG